MLASRSDLRVAERVEVGIPLLILTCPDQGNSTAKAPEVRGWCQDSQTNSLQIGCMLATDFVDALRDSMAPNASPPQVDW
jgi:hypothetical protein